MATIYEYAQIAQDIYDNSQGTSLTGWTRSNFDYDAYTTYAGATYTSKSGSEIIVAYRGSSSTQDWLGPDFQLANGDLPRRQFNLALRQFAGAHANKNLTVCGHSLGGGLAQLVAAQTGVYGVGFNAPEMGNVIRQCGVGFNHDKCVNLRVFGDAVSRIGLPIGKVIVLKLALPPTPGGLANSAAVYAAHSMTKLRDFLQHDPIGKKTAAELIDG